VTDKLDTTNIWLAIIALVSLFEFLLIVIAGVMAYVAYRRTTTAMRRLELEHVVPMAAKVKLALDEIHDLSDRVQRADDKVRRVVSRVEDVASHVSTVATNAWPVIGTWRAVSAGVSALLRRRGAARLSSRHAAHVR
jgi:hypothetical protein